MHNNGTAKSFMKNEGENMEPQSARRKTLCSPTALLRFIRPWGLDYWKEAMNKIYEAQLLTYLRVMNKRVGLLINFNVERVTDGVKRLIM
jgi:hypothetical protein